jgi:tetratricopeptide (TPR) repeat protein
VAAARRYVERARPEHPSLIDQAHVLDELFGIVNVPSGVWIDEEGTIVRPPEPAFAPRPPAPSPSSGQAPPRQLSPYMTQVLAEAAKLRVDRRRYVEALRDWARSGSSSKYALSAAAVLERSRPRSLDESKAAAHFELGQHLYRAGKTDAAVAHFREAHGLQPENWTYKRQAWSLADPEQGPTSLYEGDWLGDVRQIGVENYYPALELD